MNYYVFSIVLGGLGIGLLIAGFYVLVQISLQCNKICKNLDARVPKEDGSYFWIRLTDIKLDKRLTEREIAHRTGASISTVRDWLDGVSTPHLALVPGILNLLEDE
jgi:DNA-binding transcriptional regulator YiaG